LTEGKKKRLLTEMAPPKLGNNKHNE